MKLIVQPEIAYVKRGRKVVSQTDPPDGYLFDPCYFDIKMKTTQDELFDLLMSRLIKLENHDPGEVDD